MNGILEKQRFLWYTNIGANKKGGDGNARESEHRVEKQVEG